MAQSDKARSRKGHPSDRGREFEARCAVKGLLFAHLNILWNLRTINFNIIIIIIIIIIIGIPRGVRGGGGGV